MKTKINKWIIIPFLASMLSIAYVTPAGAQYLPDEYTVGLWHLDKEFGTALDFDSNDYVAVPDSTVLEPANITVEAWVKHLGSPGTYRYILNKQYDPGWASYGLYTRNTGGLWFYIGTETTYYPSPDAGAGVWDGNWHHIAGTFDGSYVRLYVDGNEVGTGTLVPIGTSIAYDGAGINIGGPSDKSLGGPYHFDGVIDEVRISNVARTSFDLFTPLTVDSDTVALWHFDEGSGQSVSDATVNGNNGRLGSTIVADDNDPTWLDSTLAIDSSSNENHGTIYGATWATGVFDSALSFDEDDYVEVLDNPILDFGTDNSFSVEAWVKTTAKTDMIILAKRAHNSWDNLYLLYARMVGTELRATFYLRDGPTAVYAIGTTDISDGGWHHVMGVRNKSTGTVRIYVDGIPYEQELGDPTGDISNAANLWIGRQDYTDYPSWQGLIDEVRISNVARLPVDIDIDIKPDSDPNSICLSKQGLLPVAILSTDAFDATQIDPFTLALGGVEVSYRGGGKKKTPKLAFSIDYVDGDDNLDMIVFFSVPELVDNGLDSTTTALELTGFLTDGTHIKGIDSVRIVPE